MTKTLIHTALSPEQCCERLDAAIDSDRIVHLGGAFGSKAVMGRVDDAGFRLQMRINYQNSFKTFLWGRFVPNSGGTTIELRTGMQPLVVAVMRFWMTVAIVGSLAAGFAALCNLVTGRVTEALGQIVLCVVFPLFFTSMSKLGRWMAKDEEGKLVQFVIDAFKAS